MTKATTTSKPAKRSRAKSAASAVPTAINQTVLLRIEPRLRWTGSIDLVPLAGGGGRSVHVLCHDAKLKVDLDWRGSQASESAALIEAFNRIEAWVEETRKQQRGPDWLRLHTVFDQLRAHRRQLVVEGVPETLRDAAAKESAVDEWTAAECNRDGTSWSLAEWTARLNEIVDLEAWQQRIGKANADEQLATWYHDGLSRLDAARVIDPSIDGEMDLRDDESAAEGAFLQELPLEQIAPSPLNPRQTMDEAALQELAQSIQTLGLLQPIVVCRAAGERPYEIIAGERRYRAAALAGLTTILCRVLDCTPEQALELRVVENLQREDLQPIDEARGFQSLLDRCGYSQRTLAERLGVSQGHVGNRLGLLRLPEPWQQRISRGEINATMARELIPWVERPPVLEEVAQELGPPDGERLSTEDFADLVRTVVRKQTLPVSKGMYYRYQVANGTWRFGSVLFTAKDLIRWGADLDIAEVPTRDGQGTEPRAFARERWIELHGNLEAKAAKRQQARQAKQLGSPPPAASASESDGESAAAQERERQQRAAVKLRESLARYVIRWYQGQILDRLDAEESEAQLDGAMLLRLALYFGARYGSRHGIHHDRRDSLLEALQEERGQTRRLDIDQLWGALAQADEPQLWRALAGTLRRWLERDPFSNYADLQAEDLPAMARSLAIDLPRRWRVEDRFLALHTREQLETLARGWKITLSGGKRDEVIAEILAADQARRLPPPKDLLAAAKASQPR